MQVFVFSLDQVATVGRGGKRVHIQDLSEHLDLTKINKMTGDH